MTRALALLLVAGLLLTGCADDKERYCDAVRDNQRELGETLGAGGPDALLNALPTFRELAEDAPRDIRDEWATVIDALEGLQDALDAAGVDAATYDREDPPDAVTQEQRDAIDAAAARLTDEQTVAALGGVEQQAKDVCGTPLRA